MTEVVNVAFRMAPRTYYFDPRDLPVELGCLIVAETTRGLEIGQVVKRRHAVPDEEIPQPLKPVLRLATGGDIERDARNRDKELEAREACVRQIREHNLPMRLVAVSYTLDGSRVVFYFSAEGRVDFRDLVRDLARTFRTRIELHQVGVRDQARMAGGYGTCGRPLCCATFLSEFLPVAIRMAKEQDLALNPTKISGMCGRLMCCLRYEYDTYRDLRGAMPKKGTIVETPAGSGTVVDHELLKGRVAVEINEEETQWFRLEELTPPEPVRKKQRRRSRGGRRRGRRADGTGAAPPEATDGA